MTDRTGDPAPDRVRLVVSDVDGTLVTPDKRLTARTIEAAATLRARGIGLALVSARPPRGLAPLLARLPTASPHAGFNGGEIVSAAGEVLEALHVPPEAAHRALAMLADAGIGAWVFADGAWFVTDPDGDCVPLERETIGMAPTVVAGFGDLAARAGKIMGVSNDHARLARVEREIAAALGDTAAAHRSQDYYLDITHPDARKDHAVRRLAALAGVPLAAVAAIGDMTNDLPMLRVAGVSIAMGNATDEVRAAARHVAGTNSDEGWADAMERFVLATWAETGDAVPAIGATA